MTQNLVIAGHQVGLLGGPLFAMYKAFGAVTLAQEIGGKAVYWIEGNDADFDEIKRIHYITKEGKLKSLTWDIKSHGYPIGSIKVDTMLLDLYGEFFEDLPVTEHTSSLQTMCFDSYVLGRTLMTCALSFARKLYKDISIEFFDSTEASFLEFAKPYLLAEANRTENDFQANLFALVDGKREALFKQDNHYYTRQKKRIELEQYVLLPNVKIRNIIQDAYFKPHTYIAGPHEKKYIRDLHAGYQFHKIQPAAVKERMSLVILRASIQKRLHKLGFSWEHILSHSHEALQKEYLLEKEGIDLSAVKKEAFHLTRAYTQSLSNMDLEVKSVEKWLYHKMKEVVGIKRKNVKAKHEKAFIALQEVVNTICPYGQHQERIFNLVWVLNLYGRDFMKKVMNKHLFDKVILEMP